ncbi:YVTN family beta-propeller repeat protein [Desulfosporosinus orientis DSM 765]|uniref:YVTN family beta-propeller repeat protein n=1 Tax=Desulfosporosinus orientis (strain ATCC 19365 / DSM 765 / NCIMB 8382 / VKM B-1628 / Singapore I) TaxID=768706 RepID=G7W553_DESOD|nr:YncE family protein [Desulfosporosinus orientis]AET66069.1 YVTN family beta-propeller repeat protein [Desulfosporosinus orientis DSM 765]
MASLTTGLIENTGVSGSRFCSKLSVRITNKDLINGVVRICGYYWTDTLKKEYVLDLLTLAPGEVRISSFYAKFDLLEFQFITSTDAVEISVWGEDDTGSIKAVYNLLPPDILPMDWERNAAEVKKQTIPSFNSRIYVLDSNSNHVSVIDEKTNTPIGSISMGSGPYGIGINPTTSKIYVANFGSNNISVIDADSNVVLTTITVGANPVGVAVNPVTNKIYVTNWRSHSVSVIDGFTHVVRATIMVEEFPEGIIVNSETNLIYIANHGNNSVTVINGNTNTVINSIALS